MSKLTKKQAQWKVHLDAASSARQSLAEYARSNKLDLKKLYSYSSAIQRRSTPRKSAFVRVQRAPVSPVDVRIELNNGVRVIMPSPADIVSFFEQLAKLP
jgi:hypothetical protein